MFTSVDFPFQFFLHIFNHVPTALNECPNIMQFIVYWILSFRLRCIVSFWKHLNLTVIIIHNKEHKLIFNLWISHKIQHMHSIKSKNKIRFIDFKSIPKVALTIECDWKWILSKQLSFRNVVLNFSLELILPKVVYLPISINPYSFFNRHHFPIQLLYETLDWSFHNSTFIAFIPVNCFFIFLNRLKSSSNIHFILLSL